MRIVPGNQTTVTVNPVDQTWLFAMSANTPSGSTGLSQGWLCKYLHYARLEEPPRLLDSSDITEHSILVKWIPLTCVNGNKARLISYVLTYEDVVTGLIQSFWFF